MTRDFSGSRQNLQLDLDGDYYDGLDAAEWPVCLCRNFLRVKFLGVSTWIIKREDWQHR